MDELKVVGDIVLLKSMPEESPKHQMLFLPCDQAIEEMPQNANNRKTYIFNFIFPILNLD
jgi:hypothetical protein